MEHQNSDIFAALKFQGHIMLGKVISMNDNELIFQSVSDDEIPVESIQEMDVFGKGKIYFRNLPVTVISNQKTIDERSFSKMILRNIKVRYNRGLT